MFSRAASRLSSDEISAAPALAANASEDLLRIADEFRLWVTTDLQALPGAERLGFRGDYLFVIDGEPLFLVVVTPENASSLRCVQGGDWGSLPLKADMGAPVELGADALESILAGQVRVQVETDGQTLRRLLQGTMKAKAAYLTGRVRISGDLPCFMRLVAVLKGRGVRPVSQA